MLDRWLQKVGKIHGAEFLMQREIAIQGTRHGDGGTTRRRHRVEAGRLTSRDRAPRSRASAGIEAVEFSLPVDQHKRIPTQSVHHWLGDIDHGGHGDGRIRCIASSLEDIAADHCCGRLTGAGDAVFGIDRPAPVVERFHRSRMNSRFARVQC